MLTAKTVRDLRRADDIPRVLSARQARKARKLNPRIKRELRHKLMDATL